MKALVVGGTFDENGGKPSKIIEALAQGLSWPVINGGTLEDLKSVDFTSVDTLLWMPNIDNAEEKILPAIKAANPKLTLISSKRVVEKSYNEFDIITRLLKSRSNLGIMITKEEGTYRFRLLDPLGNQYVDTQKIDDLAKALNERVSYIKSLSRIGSRNVGEALDAEVNPLFMQQVLRLGDEFSKHVNAVNPGRFLGNASLRSRFEDITRTTRCCHGFPGQRSDGVILVSRRNVDKQNMSPKDFVAVNDGGKAVEYLGEVKPSVDTPIQLKLFNYYSNVNYMIHGHVYVEGAPMTHSIVPCGHLEEFDEIKALYPDNQAKDFIVNLKGHGCLILAEKPEFFDKVKLRSRPFPELAYK